MSNGQIIAEYENYSIWETSMSEPTLYVAPGDKLENQHKMKLTSLDAATRISAGSYWVAFSYQTKVSTYEQALLEPEWLVFQ